MLYTVVPLERIYARPASYTDIKQERPKEKEEIEYHELLLKNGRVIARREGKEFIVERINSTDMSDYLNEAYTPGKSIKG
jgi:hypothetical protein